MRLLYINDVLIDIDKNTAIGIDLQTYDIKNPAKRKITISNEFTIPITNNNLQAIGQINSIQSLDNTIYNQSTCNYYIDNIQYINNSRVKITEIADRITCYVYDKADIWDELKTVTWFDFAESYFDSLDIPKISTPVNGWANFITPYTLVGGSDGIFLPITIPNNKSNGINLYTSYVGYDDEADLFTFSYGGAFMAFVIDVFKYIENTYGINFYTDSTFSGNIWNDSIINSMYFSYRHIYPVILDGSSAGNEDYYFKFVNDSITPVDYGVDGLAQETNDKTLYQFIQSFIQQLNIMVIPESDGFKMVRFDDLENMPVIDFSGKITGTPKFKPFIDGYGQNNFIKFSDVQKGIDPYTNARKLTSLNKNIDVNKDLITIDAYMPSVSNNEGVFEEYVPVLNTVDSFSNFKFFVNNGQRSSSISSMQIRIISDVLETFAVINDMYHAAIYSLDGEYQLIDKALKYPKYYEIKKWLTATELNNFNFFRQYFIRELGGSYFINKIKGFNPELSRQAVTLEVFKVSDQTPDSSYVELDAYTDGMENIFVDTVGNYYI